jgi:hypothetical protein
MKHLKTILILCLLIPLVAGCAAPTAEPTATPVPPTPTLSPAGALENIHWFGSLSVLYHGSKNIYFDPNNLLGDVPKADIILITHSHVETWNINYVKQIIGPNTTMIISPNMTVLYEQYKDELGVPAIVLAEGESTEVDGVKITATHVLEYTRHLPAAGIVGYLVEIDGITLYDASETKAYPEMAQIKADITFFPLLFSKDDILEVAGVLPTRYMIIVSTSPSGSKTYADLFNKQGLPVEFAVPGTGKYVP